MKKNDLILLENISDCIQNILSYTEDFTIENFLSSRITQDATLRNLEVIGEATKKLSEEIRTRYPDIEWKKMAGMRDKLIHDYQGVDLWAVWYVVEDLLPGLLDKIREIIRKEGSA